MILICWMLEQLFCQRLNLFLKLSILRKKRLWILNHFLVLALKQRFLFNNLLLKIFNYLFKICFLCTDLLINQN